MRDSLIIETPFSDATARDILGRRIVKIMFSSSGAKEIFRDREIFDRFPDVRILISRSTEVSTSRFYDPS